METIQSIFCAQRLSRIPSWLFFLLMSVGTAFAINPSNPGDPLYCQPNEGTTFLIVNGGSGIFTVNADCYGNNTANITQSSITTAKGGTLTLSTTAVSGNYLYTPPTPNFTGTDTFNIDVTTVWNSAGGMGSAGGTSSPGGPATLQITLNVIPAASTASVFSSVPAVLPVPAGYVAGCTPPGNPAAGPSTTDVVGCTTAVIPSNTVRPSHGYLTQRGKVLLYTALNGYTGSDTFTYRVQGTNTDGNYALNSGDVTMTVTVSPAPPIPPATIYSSQNTLSFQTVLGLSTAAAVQLLPVLATRYDNSTTFQASPTTPWLTLDGAAGSLPGNLSVNVDSTGMKAGTYQGSINVTTGASSFDVPVTLSVVTPSPITVSPSTFSVASTYHFGSATGFDIQVGPAGMPYSVQVPAAAAPWLSVSSTSGIAPALVHVIVDSSNAVYGNYRTALTITSPGAPNSPVSVPVSLAVGSLSPIAPQMNGASLKGPDSSIAPNELVALGLTDFACDSSPRVTLNGTAAQVLTFVPNQVNYVVPDGAASGPLVVSCDGTPFWSFANQKVATTMPALFSADSTGIGQGSIINSDGSANSAANPASRGDFISVFATGLGNYGTVSDDGLRRVAASVAASLGDAAGKVIYAGETPTQSAGLQQVNISIPADAPTGSLVPLTLFINGVPTQSGITVAIK